MNTIEQARTDGCNTVVYASSVYGDQTEPLPEHMTVETRTGYASKLARER